MGIIDKLMPLPSRRRIRHHPRRIAQISRPYQVRRVRHAHDFLSGAHQKAKVGRSVLSLDDPHLQPFELERFHVRLHGVRTESRDDGHLFSHGQVSEQRGGRLLRVRLHKSVGIPPPRHFALEVAKVEDALVGIRLELAARIVESIIVSQFVVILIHEPIQRLDVIREQKRNGDVLIVGRGNDRVVRANFFDEAVHRLRPRLLSDHWILRYVIDPAERIDAVLRPSASHAKHLVLLIEYPYEFVGVPLAKVVMLGVGKTPPQIGRALDPFVMILMSQCDAGTIAASEGGVVEGPALEPPFEGEAVAELAEVVAHFAGELAEDCDLFCFDNVESGLRCIIGGCCCFDFGLVECCVEYVIPVSFR
mmetsp:Transcript_41276/g.86646  ORF Transcript_41276/g.86646 Transcript_41276/m.86646 type:complete len:363 (-) Transcript_41276:138-1226(-)